MPEDDKLPSLQELGDKIAKAKQESLGEGNGDNPSGPGAMSVGIELLAGVVAGSFIGYYLDKWLGSSPWLFITCFFLGIAGATRNIMRSVNKASDNEK